jgi:predicted aconitase with swiveling domain
MREVLGAVTVTRGVGSVVDGELILSRDGFSPRYDLNRLTGVITRKGHDLEGASIADRICVFTEAKGGIAAGWAYNDLQHKRLAPRALVFGVTNPVMVQGAIFAGIPLTEGWSQSPFEFMKTGDWVRVDPGRCVIELLRRA